MKKNLCLMALLYANNFFAAAFAAKLNGYDNPKRGINARQRQQRRPQRYLLGFAFGIPAVTGGIITAPVDTIRWKTAAGFPSGTPCPRMAEARQP